MLDSIFSHLNILYIFLCNVVTYIILGCFNKDLATGWKRLISALVAGALGLICIYHMGYDKEVVFTSFFVQFLMYDYVVKWFMNKINTSKVDTEKINEN